MTQSLHEKRGISFAELGALYGTRAMLQAKVLSPTNDNYPNPHEHGFNMQQSCATSECGSVSCIGGTMALIMGLNEKQAQGYVGGRFGGMYQTANGDYVQRAPTLNKLFYPPAWTWEWITPRVAIKAIDNWLNTGRPNWTALKKEYGPKRKATK